MRLLLAIVIVTATACATAGTKMNSVSLGMTKAEVINTVGSPNSTKAASGVEVLEYTENPMMSWTPGSYWVVLQNGRVTQYGKAGDFGSASPETKKLILDVTQH